jgi:hypothetical protein
MMYLHDRSTDADRESHQRWLEAHGRWGSYVNRTDDSSAKVPRGGDHGLYKRT